MNPSESRLPKITQASKRLWIWLIPIAAILSGAGLLWQHYQERGVLIHVRFDTAEGLSAGKTQLRYKDISIGTLESLSLDSDLNHITAHIRAHRSIEPYLLENTRFWVVRPRIDKQGVSGLTTLFSGAYIAIEPGTGKPATNFIGLENPPLTPTETPGVRIVLVTDSGGVGIGTPIYYKKISVGTVEAMRFSPDHHLILLDTFIQAPYDRLVTTASRFWRSSGVYFKMSSEGIQFRSEALESILSGGISFDSPEPGAPVADSESHFPIFPTHDEIESLSFKRGQRFVLYFDSSVRGLSPGAAVDFQGVQIGEVLDISLEYNAAKDSIHIPVTISVLTSRLTGSGHPNPDRYFMGLLEQGLKAHLEIGSILTNQLFISLKMDKKHPSGKIAYTANKLPIIPTHPHSITQLVEKTVEILGKIQKIPFDKIGNDLAGILQSTKETVENMRDLPNSLNLLMENTGVLVTNLDKTLLLLNQTLEGLQPGSPSYMELHRATKELSQAAKAIRLLAESLEERPDTLIFGK